MVINLCVLLSNTKQQAVGCWWLFVLFLVVVGCWLLVVVACCVVGFHSTSCNQLLFVIICLLCFQVSTNKSTNQGTTTKRNNNNAMSDGHTNPLPTPPAPAPTIPTTITTTTTTTTSSTIKRITCCVCCLFLVCCLAVAQLLSCSFRR